MKQFWNLVYNWGLILFSPLWVWPTFLFAVLFLEEFKSVRLGKARLLE